MQAERPTSSSSSSLQEQETMLLKELASIEQAKKRLKSEDGVTASASLDERNVKEGEKMKDGSVRFNLSNKRFVSVKVWKGKPLVDVREFYEKDGELLPGKTGLSMTPEQWEMLKSLAPSIDAALTKM